MLLSRFGGHLPTPSSPRFPAAADVLEGRVEVDALDAVWAGDHASLPAPEGWRSAVLSLDLCSRIVVGRAMRDDLERHLRLDAPTRAFKSGRPPPGLLNPGDRARQPASRDRGAVLDASGTVCSMGPKGACRHPAVAALGAPGHSPWLETLIDERLARRLDEVAADHEASRLPFAGPPPVAVLGEAAEHLARSSCPGIANPTPANFDGDQAGDARDPDVDGAAVAHDGDQRPFAALRPAVLPSSGCARAQLGPGAAPRGAVEPWRNHGQYLAGVTRELHAFVNQGLIAKSDRGHPVSLAAERGCGKR